MLVADGLNNFVSGVETVFGCVVSGSENEGFFNVPESDCSKIRCWHLRLRSVLGALVSAAESECIRGLLEVSATGLLEVGESVSTKTEAAGAPATAGVSEGIFGLLEGTESDSPSLPNSLHSSNSCLWSSTSACARLPRAACAFASARVCLVVSSSAEFAAVAQAHASILQGARNSWSDTNGVQGPTGARRVKGGVSGPAEDLRPVSEVVAGVNFRPAGGVRGQVAGFLPRRQPGTGTRQVRGGAVTLPLHPEVPGIQFVSPGDGLDIRQSMGWTKVCSTARSGIWVL